MKLSEVSRMLEAEGYDHVMVIASENQAPQELTAGILDGLKEFLNPEYAKNAVIVDLINDLQRNGKAELKLSDKDKFKRLKVKLEKLGVGYSTSVRNNVIHVMLRNGYSNELDRDSRFDSQYAA